MPPTSNNGMDGDDHAERLRLNPEILKGKPPLLGLEDVQVIYMQPASFLQRCMEGVAVHILGGCVLALIGFVLGVVIG